MEVPDLAIQWLVKYASSNTELAAISNVSRKWRQIAVQVILEQAADALSQESEQKDKLLLLPSMIRYLISQEKSTDNEIESYCIAWFHPDGMEIKQLSIDEDDSDSDDYQYGQGDDSDEPFAPSGGAGYAGSDNEKKKGSSRRRRSKSPTPLMATVSAGLRQQDKTDSQVSCMYQWNGYKEAMDILKPFGFETRFVERLIKLGQLEASAMRMMMDTDIDKGSLRGPKKSSSKAKFGKQSTFAVRGAIAARPEGYCLCWDSDQLHVPSSAGNSDVRKKEEALQLKRRNRRRRELQREVLPRVLCSTPFKDPYDVSKSGNVQPCIQFLNVDGSHAVRLFTPPFKPGPIPAPITIFCVGIATEDGCFISGQKNRFELGHLYPATQADNIIERSAISICTDIPDSLPADGENGGKGGTKAFDEDGGNSDDSSCDMSLDEDGGDPGIKCGCPYSSIEQTGDEQDESGAETGNLYRGSRGPGMWHVYTAVFDGDNSEIRIDGVPEPLHKNSSRMDIESLAASLDGFTIGADHTFDMSLCFGQGSEGEGEGAMSELVAFKGHLDTRDIETIEKILMEKHGIAVPIYSFAELEKESNYYRLAHGMLANPPNHKIFGRNNKQGIPLKYMAKHRLVAWRQINSVTGETIQVSRIGTKMAESSSDW